MHPPVPADRPGQLLSAEPMTAYLVPGVRMPGRAWRIRYTSTTATGGRTEVTGTVLVPHRRSRPDNPLIGYAVGTQGLADRCAASWQLARGVEYEAPFLAMALRRGWTLAVTDYPGLGTPGEHPYVIGHALGPAVLDCMRAARALPEAGLDPQGPAAIHGYSEGGCAAGWALQLQPTYAPDIPLAAGVVGAAPADLAAMINRHEGGMFAFLLVYGLLGLDAAYPELDALSYLTGYGRAAAAVLRRTHIVPAVPLGWLAPSKRIDRYVTRRPQDVPAIRARLRENRLGDRAPAAPVLLGSSTWEQITPHSQMVRLAADWASLGVPVTLHIMPYREHLTGALCLAPRAFRFLDHHLARPANPITQRIA
ncbi:putative lipase [Nocardia brasiliensis NBRC 14402]|uniref:lipase family protein n=1 Tax=Nocardia brasiliensis TaxID=37326 RepID=UPI00045C9932|nr:lipase family protein [Nocardia brasiliensis]ASF12749.1 lipase [Nocardia brasiliensis]GAJ84109.1 putative lipase [Nocardia brasiliensis NBRC 14402]SUB48077.1 Secretory lipase [Nocardia brasiliensis]